LYEAAVGSQGLGQVPDLQDGGQEAHQNPTGHQSFGDLVYDLPGLWHVEHYAVGQLARFGPFGQSFRDIAKLDGHVGHATGRVADVLGRTIDHVLPQVE